MSSITSHDCPTSRLDAERQRRASRDAKWRRRMREEDPTAMANARERDARAHARRRRSNLDNIPAQWNQARRLKNNIDTYALGELMQKNNNMCI
jgi:hypothetical protein